MFDDGVLEGDTVRTHEVGIDDEIVLGLGVADSHLGVPNAFGIGGLTIHAGCDSGN